LIEAEKFLVQPGVYDGVSARLIQQMGFKSGSSGGGLSESTLGWADVGLLSCEEDVSLARDDIALAAKDVSKPFSVNMGFGIRARPTTPLLCVKELQDLGVAVAEINDLMELGTIREMEQRFLTAQQLTATYGPRDQT